MNIEAWASIFIYARVFMTEPINQVILNFLDRMIDETVRSAEALSALRSIIAEQRAEQKESISDVKEMLDTIERQFSNEFKSEIKDHISRKTEETRSIFDEGMADLSKHVETAEDKKRRIEHYDRFEKFIQKVESPKFWMTLFVSFVISISTLVGGIATVIYRLPAIMGWSQPRNESLSTTPPKIKMPEDN